MSPIDGRTRLARAARRFEAHPTRETAERLVRLLSPANGRPWKMSDAVERTGVPAEVVSRAISLLWEAGSRPGSLRAAAKIPD
jgi:hypothetical protein